MSCWLESGLTFGLELASRHPGETDQAGSKQPKRTGFRDDGGGDRRPEAMRGEYRCLGGLLTSRANIARFMTILPGENGSGHCGDATLSASAIPARRAASILTS